MLPGQALDLDHADDRPGWLGFSHAKCNRQAGGRLGSQRRRARRERTKPMLDPCWLAIEVAESRQNVAIAAAGRLDDGYPAVELAGYLSGVAGVVAEVLRLKAERTVHAVIVDPRSNAANLIRPLRDAKIRVVEPTFETVAVAHGDFVDKNNTGELRHVPHPLLDAAVRAMTERRLAGGVAWDRHGGGPVDVSPGVAAELALWGLLTVPPPPKPMLVIAGAKRPGA
jgi:hypothetical protein